jgi:hypothetical protein
MDGDTGLSDPANVTALVGMALRFIASADDLKAVCSGIATGLRTFLSEVLREPVPDEMAELLQQLDQPTTKRAEC